MKRLTDITIHTQDETAINHPKMLATHVGILGYRETVMLPARECHGA